VRSLPPGAALLPLRLFLGLTFCYAGVQKLSDPGFLHAGAETYIGTQLEAFADGTPGGPLLRALALPHPELAGVGVALSEIAIGLLAVAGRFTRAAAACGLALSLVLFLTASWHTSPYFLGSDIVFAFAWLPFVLAGAAGQPALDHARSRALLVRPASPGAGLTRRAAILQALGLAAAATSTIAGASLLTRGTLPARSRATAGGAVADSAALAPGDALTLANPADGSPALVIRRADGALAAFGATCTHQGCEVAWRNGDIRCPCHHARFDPETGEPTRGPARAPLPALDVSERGGKIVLG
jgi:thiosulfate dehydrogenase [quinone] large subunit